MAIINSVVVGRGKKSVGEVTLAYQRGRTIARRRVFENKSRTSLQTVQRNKFKTIVKLVAPYKNFFCPSFERTQYGSQYNAFIKRTAERWLSPEFLLMVDETGFADPNADTAAPFNSVLNLLTNGVTIQTQAKYGDGLPYVGYGSITPVSYDVIEEEQRHNTAKQIDTTVNLDDGKGWALDVIGFVVNKANSNFEGIAGRFIQKTYNLYERGDFPSLQVTVSEGITAADSAVSTNQDAGTVRFILRANSMLVDLIGGTEKVDENGATGILNVSIRKYQKYIKNTTYLSGSVVKTA